MASSECSHPAPTAAAAAGAVAAVVNAADKSAVAGKAEDVVAAARPILNGIKGFPVSPPANPADAPVVVAKAPAS